jgi:acetoacetate decarboxylase
VDITEIWKGQLTTPLGAPAYPFGPYRFFDREYLNIVYRTDKHVLKHLLPEPLVPTEPLVRFEVMKMPDSTGLGSYLEAGQVLHCAYQGENAEYLHAMYVSGPAAIASGREIAAYPKKAGEPALYVDGDALVGTLDYGSLRVATATMGYKYKAMDLGEAAAQLGVPTFMLKLMPGYDGQPRIAELVRTSITKLTVKQAWTGPGRLDLRPHALAPLADLPVLEIVEVSHMLTDLTLSPMTLVHDYLA